MDSIPLEEQIRENLRVLGLHILDGDDIVRLPIECGGLRAKLLEKEQIDPESSKPLADGNFWDLSEKCRFDYLGNEIVDTANNFAYAISLAAIYRPLMSQTQKWHGFPNMADQLFWMYIDYGIRVASSCWDRLGLFIDLAFELDLNTRCSFTTALSKLEISEPDVLNDGYFQKLKAFQEGKFKELHDGPGKGLRNDVTHYFNPRMRHFFTEILIGAGQKDNNRRNPDFFIEFLCNHHKEFLSGLDSGIKLVAKFTSS